MAIIYNWEVHSVKYDVPTGGINQARWQCQGIDESTNNVGSKIGTTTLSPDPTDSNFIAYENVTQENVVAWIQSNVDVTSIQNSIDAQIATKNNSQEETGLPWATDSAQ